MIAFGIAAMHRRKDLWGEDADDFRPERWRNEKSSWVSIEPSLTLAVLCFKLAESNPLSSIFRRNFQEDVLIKMTRSLEIHPFQWWPKSLPRS